MYVYIRMHAPFYTGSSCRSLLYVDGVPCPPRNPYKLVRVYIYKRTYPTTRQRVCVVVYVRIYTIYDTCTRLYGFLQRVLVFSKGFFALRRRPLPPPVKNLRTRLERPRPLMQHGIETARSEKNRKHSLAPSISAFKYRSIRSLSHPDCGPLTATDNKLRPERNRFQCYNRTSFTVVHSPVTTTGLLHELHTTRFF